MHSSARRAWCARLRREESGRPLLGHLASGSNVRCSAGGAGGGGGLILLDKCDALICFPRDWGDDERENERERKRDGSRNIETVRNKENETEEKLNSFFHHYLLCFFGLKGGILA